MMSIRMSIERRSQPADPTPVVVQILHGRAQRGLQSLGMVLKEPEHNAPDHGGEEGKGVWLLEMWVSALQAADAAAGSRADLASGSARSPSSVPGA